MTTHWQWSWCKLYCSKLPNHRHRSSSCSDQHFGWVHLLRWSASCHCVGGYLVDNLWHFRRLFCGPMRDALPWTEENSFDLDSVSWGPFFWAQTLEKTCTCHQRHKCRSLHLSLPTGRRWLGTQFIRSLKSDLSTALTSCNTADSSNVT
jgi:hypothetical protein